PLHTTATSDMHARNFPKLLLCSLRRRSSRKACGEALRRLAQQLLTAVECLALEILAQVPDGLEQYGRLIAIHAGPSDRSSQRDKIVVVAKPIGNIVRSCNRTAETVRTRVAQRSGGDLQILALLPPF